MAGRPSKFKPEYVEQARNYCLLGATDDDLAKFFGVSRATISTWKTEYPEFTAALAHGKDAADARVIGSLYDNALGGNVTAQIFWLKNRRSWKDRIDAEVSGKDGAPFIVEIVKFGGSDGKDPSA
ncbi:helix-turn-helix domain-containing protein [Paraburkholderia saeva]|uniref:Terminase n=1 Tax=Paraburkholderia saeva TaxID=2777537 RepID=A0A9N8RX66_9BURK|nr:terminase [Paraburkholderia saeva]CAG4900722.1 hypothetical protein LMG31841_02910 [Paraburkholderia saeva]